MRRRDLTNQSRRSFSGANGRAAAADSARKKILDVNAFKHFVIVCQDPVGITTQFFQRSDWSVGGLSAVFADSLVRRAAQVTTVICR